MRLSHLSYIGLDNAAAVWIDEADALGSGDPLPIFNLALQE